MMHSRFSVYIHFIFFCFHIFYFCPSYAQRGQSFSEQSSTPQHNLAGFPSFFNSTVAKKGSYVFEIPTLSFDYGISENFTLGVNFLAPSLIYSLLEVYSFAMKARYNLFSNEAFSWSATIYPHLSLKQTQDYLRIYTLTSNFSYHVTSQLSFDLSLIFSALSEQNILNKIDIGTSSSEVSLYWIFISSNYFFNESFGVETNLGLSLYQSAKVDLPDTSGNISQGFQSIDKNFLGRFLLHYKTSEDTIFSGGFLSINSTQKIIPALFYTSKI